MKTTKAMSVLSFLLFGLHGATAQEEYDPKGSDLPGRPPGLWGVDAKAIEKWQLYLGEPDATGTFTLPGFNTSQPWSDAEPLDWTIKMAVKANMIPPDGADGKVLTGGMVWIEPPDGLVDDDNDYTAHREWSPFALYYTSLGVNIPQSEEPLTPFFHRDPGDDRPADGTCKGILPDECIESLERNAEGDFVNTNNRDHRVEDEEKCPGIGAAARISLGNPFNLTKREQDDAAMKYNEGWVASFVSGAHPEGNETDYAAHGSQFVPVLFRWMRAEEAGLTYNEPKPQGRISTLMCLAVNEAAEGKELPDPGEEYLEAVEDKEAGELFAFSLL
ncbi:uncharacterized protein DNG_10457 [Cephalotrichum gorgonifer]|uniref:Uncharacterized protein n=1 Tax=Cephalotrichum gorgonifer TaxID=2041049 RepID=A0AAE8N7S1_9PEZI|nr:uncharacterized protein DNG_10457 [Cephalotrichum gorgonifer]